MKLEVIRMAAWKCEKCGYTKESRCKHGKCPKCGATGVGGFTKKHNTGDTGKRV
jgi:rubrerythrin